MKAAAVVEGSKGVAMVGASKGAGREVVVGVLEVEVGEEGPVMGALVGRLLLPPSKSGGKGRL